MGLSDVLLHLWLWGIPVLWFALFAFNVYYILRHRDYYLELEEALVTVAMITIWPLLIPLLILMWLHRHVNKPRTRASADKGQEDEKTTGGRVYVDRPDLETFFRRNQDKWRRSR